MIERLGKRPVVVNRLRGELDDRARLDIAPGADVVGEAGRRRAERLAVRVVVGVDDADRLLRPHLDDEAGGLRSCCSGVSAKFGSSVGCRPGDRCDTRCRCTPISISRSTHASCSRSSMLVWQTLVQTPVNDLVVAGSSRCPAIVWLSTSARPAALVADDLGALDADQRRDVAAAAAVRAATSLGDEVAVGEDLEVAVGMALERSSEVRVHERLAAERCRRK